MRNAIAAPTRNGSKIRWMVVLIVSAGAMLIAGANAHLVYVAVTSQPECVAHLKDASSAPGQYRAAKSAC
jgi:hypothetical protein